MLQTWWIPQVFSLGSPCLPRDLTLSAAFQKGNTWDHSIRFSCLLLSPGQSDPTPSCLLASVIIHMHIPMLPYASHLPSSPFLVPSAIVWLWSARSPEPQLLWSLSPLAPGHHWNPPLCGRHHPWVVLLSYSPIPETGLVYSCPLHLHYDAFPPATIRAFLRRIPSGHAPFASPNAVLYQLIEATVHKFLSSRHHVKNLYTFTWYLKFYP